MTENDERQIYSPAAAYAVTEILKDIFSPEGTASWAARSRHFVHTAAGKTGTTDNYRDAWFAGYTPDNAAVVWFGYDKQEETLGQGRSGGAVAAPVWADYMKRVLWNKSDTLFYVPKNGLVKEKICLDSMQRAIFKCTNTKYFWHTRARRY